MLVVVSFSSDDRPRADERHISTQDIEHLRNFVQTPSAQETPDERDSRVMPALIHSPVENYRVRALPLRRVRPHGSELENSEGHAKATDPLFAVEHRVSRRDQDRESDDQSRNQKDGEPD